jgi:hypothetical protein
MRVLEDGHAAHAGHANHATHACVLSRSLEQTRKAAAIAWTSAHPKRHNALFFH